MVYTQGKRMGVPSAGVTAGAKSTAKKRTKARKNLL